ncbi:hypothetical protein HYS47_01200 [Candidatus Woesearchaeota archaeon]|nr:hypothetical protein [Candidatus Woesearchaeota archaeon]
MYFQKRGQVAVFIILGVILLFAVLFILYLQQHATVVPGEDIQTAVLETPPLLMPVREYMEECLRQVGRDAIVSIGMHGGYIGLGERYDEYTGGPIPYDTSNLLPTEFSAVTMSSTGSWVVPYWWYLASPNTNERGFVFDSEKPELMGEDGTTIQSQIEHYVEGHLNDCLKDFSPFPEQGLLVTPDASIPEVTATILSDHVSVSVYYPLTAQPADAVQDAQEFRSAIRHDFPIDLDDIYQLASDITSTQVNTGFLEQALMNAIDVNSITISEDNLPPTSGVGFDFAPPIWTRFEVQKRIEQLLANIVPTMGVLNTKGARPFMVPGNEEGTYNMRTSQLYNKNILLLENKYLDTEVSFLYNDWPIHFKVMDGEIITARDNIGVPVFSLFMPYQKYDLPYDVSFPVVVRLHDDAAFDGEGYDFYFALEGNVRNNEYLTSDATFLRLPAQPKQSLLCDIQQRTSGNYTIRVVDGVSGAPLDNAVVKFTSSGVMCGIGTTEVEYVAGEGPVPGLVRPPSAPPPQLPPRPPPLSPPAACVPPARMSPVDYATCNDAIIYFGGFTGTGFCAPEFESKICGLCANACNEEELRQPPYIAETIIQASGMNGHTTYGAVCAACSGGSLSSPVGTMITGFASFTGASSPKSITVPVAGAAGAITGAAVYDLSSGSGSGSASGGSSSGGSGVSLSIPTLAPGSFVSKFPMGAIGSLIVDKTGYSTFVEDIFVPNDRGGVIEVRLNRKVEVPVDIVKRNIVYDQTFHGYTDPASPPLSRDHREGGSVCGNTFVEEGDEATGTPPEFCDDGNTLWGDSCPGDCQRITLPEGWDVDTRNVEPLDPNDEVIIILEKVRKHPAELPFIQVIEQYAEGDKFTETVELVPGDYTATVFLVGHNKNIIIPKQNLCPIEIPIEACEVDEFVIAGDSRQGLPPLSDYEGLDLSQFSAEDLANYDQLQREGIPLPDDDNSFMFGYYKMPVTISSNIYHGNVALRLTALSFDLASKPEEERSFNDLNVISKYSAYVHRYKSRFLPKVIPLSEVASS